MEKDVFFADKLSMLYMSLHKTARNIILVLNKQNDGDIELYLGARDFSGNSSVSGKILEAGLEGYFPGIKFQQNRITELNFSNPAISSVSAIASLRDDKKEDFVQGIERLINATEAMSKNNRKAVLQFDIQGKFIARYNSAQEAALMNNLSNVSACCRGKYKTTGGYIWRDEK